MASHWKNLHLVIKQLMAVLEATNMLGQVSVKNLTGGAPPVRAMVWVRALCTTLRHSAPQHGFLSDARRVERKAWPTRADVASSSPR